ncbi:YgiQ family radical SAM protein [Candidatus Woesearchaeota archaeon]|nr:YgiQ family radical SAM protein [Candidatus Woesearchaeota archaeon]
MEYDIIFVLGEAYFDHPLCGAAILKRLLEKHGYTVGVVEEPQSDKEITELGKPKLFFAVSSGSMDSMVRNYTPLKKRRDEDPNLDYHEKVPDRATIVYSNWIKKHYKDSLIVLGGTEASLRRFTHFDYWENRLRRSILFDTRADILAYGSCEKQILIIADRTKKGEELPGIEGTCILSKEVPSGFMELPSHEEVSESKERFVDMQLMLTNTKNLAQKDKGWHVLQYKMPKYTSKDLDEYYELPFTRQIPKEMTGFQFSVVTHRGCIGRCNFCSITLTQGDKIISRSEDSIIREIEQMTKHPKFRGNVDDLGGPSVNMYGMDCGLCEGSCLECKKLDRSNRRYLDLLKKVRKIKGVNNVFIRSGIRYDLATPELIKEIAEHHIFDTLRVSPEHVNKRILDLMNKNKGNLQEFFAEFKKHQKMDKLSFYFMTAHPGSTIKEAEELADFVRKLPNAESFQVFTPTPMTASTCMYYTGMDLSKRKIYVPYTYNEKKKQKRLILGQKDRMNSF